LPRDGGCFAGLRIDEQNAAGVSENGRAVVGGGGAGLIESDAGEGGFRPELARVPGAGEDPDGGGGTFALGGDEEVRPGGDGKRGGFGRLVVEMDGIDMPGGRGCRNGSERGGGR